MCWTISLSVNLELSYNIGNINVCFPRILVQKHRDIFAHITFDFTKRDTSIAFGMPQV